MLICKSAMLTVKNTLKTTTYDVNSWLYLLDMMWKYLHKNPPRGNSHRRNLWQEWSWNPDSRRLVCLEFCYLWYFGFARYSATVAKPLALISLGTAWNSKAVEATFVSAVVVTTEVMEQWEWAVIEVLWVFPPTLLVFWPLLVDPQALLTIFSCLGQ